MLEPKEVEVDEYLVDTAHELCDNVINYYRIGENGLKFHKTSALCAVCAMTGEAIFSAVHDVPAMQAKLYDELFVLSPEANKIFAEDTENATVYDCIAALSYEAGAKDEDFPDMNRVLELSLSAMTEGRLVPVLPLDENDYPVDLSLGFCAEMREATAEFFADHNITDPKEKILVFAIAAGSMIQALSDNNEYDLKILIETALLMINFTFKVIPFDENYKSALGIEA